MENRGGRATDTAANLAVKPPSKRVGLFGGKNRKIMSKILPIFLFIIIISALFVPQGAEAGYLDFICGKLDSITLLQPTCMAITVSQKLNQIITDPVGTLLNITIGKLFSQIAQLFFTIANIIFFIASMIFDYALAFMLEAAFLNTEGIKIGWEIARDTANIFFIFILLGISIATILRIESYGAKQLLVKLIIIALLINFSLPLSMVIIDVSNVLALQFLGYINNLQPKECKDLIGKGKHDCSVQEKIVAITKINTVLDKSGLETAAEKAGKLKNEDKITFTRIGVVYMGASFFMIVLAFVFLAFSILFTMRSIILAFILILSPIGFLAMVLPATKQYATQWWQTLLHQSFFAPAALFMIYVSLAIITKSNLIDFGGEKETATANFAQAVQGSGGSVEIIFNFILIIGLLIGSLIVAQKLGAVGASTAIAWGKSGYKMGASYVGRAATRQTIGRAAGTAANAGWTKRMAARSPFVGGALLRTLQRGAKAGGLDKIREQRITTGMSLPPKERSQYLRKLGITDQREMFKKMSARERVEALEKGGEEFKPTFGKLIKELSAEEREKTEKVQKERKRKLEIESMFKKAKENPKDAKTSENLLGMISPKEMRKYIEEMGDEFTTISKALRNLSDTFEGAVEKIKESNPRLHGYINTGTARTAIKAEYDIRAKRLADENIDQYLEDTSQNLPEES